MKRYSFGTFLVDESNQEAFDLCNRVAALQPVPALPLVLLAPPEGGKTHLLYSIANRVKATRSGTTLGFVRAEAFPGEVQRLVEDPGPIERASRALFLVDDAEEFMEHADTLEGVVRLFLEHGHAVVVASTLPPEYLVNLTPGLREILSGGLLVRMGSYRTQTVNAASPVGADDTPWAGLAAPPLPPRARAIERDGGDDAGQLRVRIQELAAELEHVRAELALRRATEEDVERYRNAVDELKSRYRKAQQAIEALRTQRAGGVDAAALEAELGAARAALTQSRARREALERLVAQMQEELKRSAGQAAELEYAKRELAVREQSHEEHVALQQRFEALNAEHRQIKAQFEEAASARDRAVAALAEREVVLDAERVRKEELLARMRSLLDQVEARRKRAETEDASQAALLEEVAQLAEERMPLIVRGGDAETPDSLEALLAESTKEWRERCEQFEQAAQVTQDRANEAGAECMRLQVAMEQQASQMRDLQQTVSALTAEKKKLSGQLEALRQEAESGRSAGEEELRQLQEELEQAEHEHQELMNTLEEQRIELEMTRIALEARDEEQSSQAQSQSQVRAERDSARAALESMRAEHDRLRSQHKAVQRRLETALAELDALRHEAASQVAAAHAQAGELERRLASSQEQYHHTKHAGQTVAKNLKDLEQRFIETAELVSRMSHQLTSAVEADSSEAESAYLYALTRGEEEEGAQLPLEMAQREEEGEGSRGPGNPYDDEKFIPFKPAEHKINRTV